MRVTEKAQHTPGPWKAEGVDVIANDQYGMVLVGTARAPRFGVNPEANARLIAAAPALLAALREARLGLLERGFMPVSPIVERIDAAIAEAEGTP